jgi:hypothetical protein
MSAERGVRLKGFPRYPLLNIEALRAERSMCRIVPNSTVVTESHLSPLRAALARGDHPGAEAPPEAWVWTSGIMQG